MMHGTLFAVAVLSAAADPAPVVLDGTVAAPAAIKAGFAPPAKAAAAPAALTLTAAARAIAKDNGARILFEEPALRGRALRLTGTIDPATKALRVTKVQTVGKDGRVFDVDYFCHNCQLAAPLPGPCQCCGGETVLRETPVK